MSALTSIKDIITDPQNGKLAWNVGKALIVVAIGWPLIRLCVKLVHYGTVKHMPLQTSMLVSRLVRYVLFLLLAFMVLNQFGIKIGPLLGAAGVMGVAVGFASQTSLSNIISGIFLIGEEPFEIGDIIEVDNVSGFVETIGLLSLTLRTFDNKMVRIPNESLIKHKVTNVTRNPIRRYDFQVGVCHSENIAQVMKVLREVTEQHPLCLDEPEPLILFKGFGPWSLDFMIGAWVAKDDFLQMRNELMRMVKERFDQEGIKIASSNNPVVAAKP